MQPRRLFSDLMLAITACALVAAGVPALAQEQPQPPAPVIRLAPMTPEGEVEARQERLDELRAELQEVYEELFELQVRYQTSGDDAALLESLAAEREGLRARVDELSKRIAEENEARRGAVVAPQRRGEADVYLLFERLNQMGGDLDPEEIGHLFEGRDGLGEVLAIIGEQLKDLEIDVSPDRVRIETGSGGKISFTVPEELREELSAGMREIGRELNHSLSDSVGGARNWAAIIDALPDRLAQGWSDPRGRRRKIVAESAFSVGRDFEVGEDEIVQGDVLLIDGDAYVAGEVQGNVYVLLGDLIVEERGLIAEDAVSIGGRVVVDDQAEILGRRLDFGDLSGLTGMTSTRGGLAWALYVGRLVVLLALLLLIYALFHDRMEMMVDRGATHPGRTMLAGAVWFTGIFGLFVVAAVGLAVSVIGIPVVLVLAAAMGLVSTMAYLAGCELVGRRLFSLFRPSSEPATGWQGAIMGAALFELPAIMVLAVGSFGVDGMITRPLTGLEIVVRFLALALGFGAVVQTRLGRKRALQDEPDPAPETVSAGA